MAGSAIRSAPTARRSSSMHSGGRIASSRCTRLASSTTQDSASSATPPTVTGTGICLAPDTAAARNSTRRPSTRTGRPAELVLEPCPPAGRRSAAAWLDDAMFVGVDDNLHPVPQPELGEDAGDVALHGGLAEAEPGGELGVRQALSH